MGNMMTLQHPEGTMRALSLKIEALKPETPLSSSWLEVEFSGLMWPTGSRKKVKETAC